MTAVTASIRIDLEACIMAARRALIAQHPEWFGGLRIDRCIDPGRLHRMCCHPAVSSGLANYDLEKMAPMVRDPRNVVLIAGSVAGIFEFCAPGVYEGHLIALPDGRGRTVVDTGRAMLRHMAQTFGARMIWGEPARTNRAVRWTCRQLGMRSLGNEVRPNGLREIFVWEPTS